jgi:hypothetical protein
MRSSRVTRVADLFYPDAMRWMVILAVGQLAACLDTGTEGRDVLGSPDDFATPAGAYPGYEVARSCRADGPAVGVIGTGTTVLADVQAIGAVGGALHDELADVPSLWGGGGYGLACLPGVGTILYLDDWRDVDEVVERSGAYLRARDLALQVGIEVAPVPVAQ